MSQDDFMQRAIAAKMGLKFQTVGAVRVGRVPGLRLIALYMENAMPAPVALSPDLAKQIGHALLNSVTMLESLESDYVIKR